MAAVGYQPQPVPHDVERTYVSLGVLLRWDVEGAECFLFETPEEADRAADFAVEHGVPVVHRYTSRTYWSGDLVKVAVPARPELICVGCAGTPATLTEYVEQSEYENATAAENGEDPTMTPEQWCWENEGTLNRRNGHFLCTACYIAAGEPTSPSGWTAP